MCQEPGGDHSHHRGGRTLVGHAQQACSEEFLSEVPRPRHGSPPWHTVSKGEHELCVSVSLCLFLLSAGTGGSCL